MTVTAGSRNYKALFVFIVRNDLLSLPGNLVEIGAPHRGGAIFGNGAGFPALHLRRTIQRKLLNVVNADVTTMNALPVEAVCLALVRSEGEPEIARNSFRLIYEKLSPGGVIAFGCDDNFPQVTATIDEIIARHVDELSLIYAGNLIYVIKQAEVRFTVAPPDAVYFNTYGGVKKLYIEHLRRIANLLPGQAGQEATVSTSRGRLDVRRERNGFFCFRLQRFPEAEHVALSPNQLSQVFNAIGV